MQERMKTAGDEAHRDPSHLEAKLVQHGGFESELQANKGRVEAVVEAVEELMEAQHYASDAIRWGRLQIECSIEKQSSLTQNQVWEIV